MSEDPDVEPKSWAVQEIERLTARNADLEAVMKAATEQQARLSVMRLWVEIRELPCVVALGDALTKLQVKP